MAAQGSNYPSIVADVVSFGDGFAWSNPSNALVDDAVYASVLFNNPAAAKTSDYLMLTGFGFALPGNATIIGVVVEVHGYYTGVNFTGQNVNAYLQGIADSPLDSGNSLPFTTPDWVTIGDPADLTVWGVPVSDFTVAAINSSAFGVGLEMSGAGHQTTTYFIDSTRITVYYTASPVLTDIAKPAGPGLQSVVPVTRIRRYR